MAQQRSRGRVHPLPVPAGALVDPPAQAAPVAKAWLVELVAAAPLEGAADVPAGTLARDAPAFCAGVLEALASDDALDALTGPDAPDTVARLAGADGAPEAVAAVEALRRAAWLVLLDGPPGVPEPLLGDFGDRLAHVCAELAAAAVARAGAATPAPGWRQGEGPEATPPAGIVDPSRPAGPAEEPDASRDAGALPLWQDALERQLADGARTGRTFALVLVEVDALEHLTVADADRAMNDLHGVARSLRACVRRPDLLAHESDGRTWVIAADSGRVGACALAERLAAAVEETAAPHGVALTASIGIAVYPHDGRDTAGLVDAAETSMFAARAEGVAVDVGPEPEPPPPEFGPRVVT